LRREGCVSPAGLDLLFGLTSAEARLAGGLAKEHGLVDIDRATEHPICDQSLPV
jgi:hypothetical protein